MKLGLLLAIVLVLCLALASWAPMHSVARVRAPAGNVRGAGQDESMYRPYGATKPMQGYVPSGNYSYFKDGAGSTVETETRYLTCTYYGENGYIYTFEPCAG